MPNAPPPPPTVTPPIGPDRVGQGYRPIAPFRFADSRRGQRLQTLQPGTVQAIDVAGAAGIPSGASAISANVTVVNQDRAGYLTLYDCADRVPMVSTLNVRPGRPIANQTIASLDDRGRLCLYTPTRTDVLIDINGYVWEAAEGGLMPLEPIRLFDSREREVELRPGVPQRLAVTTARTGVPSDAAATVLNVTAVRPAVGGWVRVVPCDGDASGRAGSDADVSNLNTVAGRVVANSAIVALSDDGAVCIESNQPTHVVVDLTGVIVPGGLRYEPVDAIRVFDSRTRASAMTRSARTRLVIADGSVSGAASINLAAVTPTDDGYLSAWPCAAESSGLPATSNVNYPAGVNAVANGATLGIEDGHLCVYAHSGTHVVVDLFGLWR